MTKWTVYLVIHEFISGTAIAPIELDTGTPFCLKVRNL
jgi:hypothetical protein